MILNALGLSLLAGLGTGLGGWIAILRQPGRRTFGLMMGITAGVMITLSFVDLVSHAIEMAGVWMATLGFALGASFMLAVDVLIPHIRFGEKEFDGFGKPKPAEAQPVEEGQPWRRGRHHRRWRWRGEPMQIKDTGLFRTGLLVAFGIAVHNTPEGFAVGAGYAHEPAFGLFIAIAITLHNIPEGIATALPLYKAGMPKWRAARFALLSGLTEPLGALLAMLVLTSFDALVPVALAFAGGVMVFITLDELIPVAREHGHQHFTAIGIILGAIFVFLLSGIFGI
ncbi:MAG: ZIP family metal transporter [Chloroflexota bacterium]